MVFHRINGGSEMIEHEPQPEDYATQADYEAALDAYEYAAAIEEMERDGM